MSDRQRHDESTVLGPMAGFVDLHVDFAGGSTPPIARGGLVWNPVVDTPSTVWLAFGDRARWETQEAAAPGARLWWLGGTHRGSDNARRLLEQIMATDAAGASGAPKVAVSGTVVAVDSQRGKTHVITDRFGTGHVYLREARAGRPGSLGTFARAVAAGGDGTWDWEGITGFCALGFFPGNRTWWTDVRIVRPATWLVLDLDGAVVSERRWWTWCYEPVEREMGALVEEIDGVLSDVLRDEVRGRRVVVPLSGGLDSRTVAAVLGPGSAARAAASEVQGLTYGYGDRSVETRIGMAVGGASGIPTRSMRVGPYLLDRVAEVVAATEGFQAPSFARQAGVAAELAEMGDAVVGGHWGDVWFDTAGGSGGATDLVGVAMSKFHKRGGEWLLRHVCAQAIEGDPAERVRAMIADELDLIPDLGDDDMRLKALKTDQWSFRWTLASMRAYRLAVPTLLPFYDDRLADLMLRIPSGMHRGRSLQVELLTRRHPDVARVRWQATGRDLFAPEPPALVRTARGALRRAGRLVTRTPVIERNWEVQLRPFPDRLREALTPAVSVGLVTAADLDDLLARLKGLVDPSAGYAVDTLLAMAQVAEVGFR